MQLFVTSEEMKLDVAVRSAIVLASEAADGVQLVFDGVVHEVDSRTPWADVALAIQERLDTDEGRLVVRSQAECKECSASGVEDVFDDFSEVIGAMCDKCRGSGRVEMLYTPFTRRKQLTGVARVWTWDDVNSVLGIQRNPNIYEYGISYEEFLAGRMPT